ncbi:hypothetical protein L195_g056893, partial [Trifolium pratense]
GTEVSLIPEVEVSDFVVFRSSDLTFSNSEQLLSSELLFPEPEELGSSEPSASESFRSSVSSLGTPKFFPSSLWGTT